MTVSVPGHGAWGEPTTEFVNRFVSHETAGTTFSVWTKRREHAVGRIRGAAHVLERFGLFDVEEMELMTRLVTAWPREVPFRELHHNSLGRWAKPKHAANTVCELRRKLGKGAITTVKGSGYRLNKRGAR